MFGVQGAAGWCAGDYPVRPSRWGWRIAAALLFVLLPAIAHAGNQVWTGTSPRAKSIEAIASDPLNPLRFWAATFGGGVARTTDGGATWTTERTGLVNTFVRCLAVQPHHPDSLYCGTNDGIFLSTDGGLSFSKLLSTNVSVRAIAIHPIRTGVLYAATNGSGVYKSINAGKNWSQTNLGLTNVNVRDVAINPAWPETLLAGTGTGGGIHRSLNGGLTWAQVPDTTGTLGACEQVAWDALVPLRAYAAELDRGVLKSTDGGLTWLRINNGLTTFRERSLSVADSLRYVGSFDQGVFTTSVSDTSWHRVSAGLTGNTVDALWSPASSPATCWAGTDGFGISRTTNRGSTWTQLDGGLLNTFGFALAFRPSSHTVYVGCGFGDQFWRSADFGSTWTRTDMLFSHDSEQGLALDPVLSRTVYVSAYGAGVYRSDDDGATFYNPDSLNATLVNPFARNLVAWPGQSGHLFVGTGDGVWESVDGGAVWVPRNGGGLPASFSVRALALVPVGTGTIYAGSDTSGLWTSLDGGKNWASVGPGIPTPFIQDVLVDLGNSSWVYAGTDSGVFKSVNGGASWSRAGTGLPYGALGSVRALAQDALHPTVLFCGIFGSGVYESLDGAATWAPVFGNTGLANRNVRSLVVDGSRLTVYAGTGNGVASLANYIPPVGVGTVPVSERLALTAWPNPVNEGSLALRFSLPVGGRASLALYNLAGRRVRGLVEGAMPAGPGELAWDRRDAAGRLVPPGLYFARLESDGAIATRRIWVLER